MSSIHAKVVYKNLSTPISLTTTASSGSGLMIDLDGKTYADLQFRYDKWATGEWFFHIQPFINVTRVGCTSKTNSYTLPYATMYEAGDTFGSTSQFQSSDYFHPIIGDIEDSHFLNKGRKYIGIEFKLTAGVNKFHYCWMEVELTNSGTDKTLTVYSWAYEDEAGKSIIIGDTSSTNQPIMVNSILINSNSTTINTKGGTLQLSAQISPSNASNKVINWTVVDTTLASISQLGLLTAKKDGQVMVLAKATDGSNTSAYIMIEITNQNVTLINSIQVTGKDGQTVVTIGENNLQMTANINPSDASNKSLTWSVDNTAIASIDQSGNLKGLSQGLVMVTAQANDGSNVSGSCSITVEEKTVSVFDNNASPNISIYPVPTSGIMTISTNNSAISIDQISIYNLSGQEFLSSIYFSRNKVELDVSMFSLGTYLLQVNLNNGQLIIKKVVIK